MSQVFSEGNDVKFGDIFIYVWESEDTKAYKTYGNNRTLGQTIPRVGDT